MTSMRMQLSAYPQLMREQLESHMKNIARTQDEICAYCGSPDPETRDHVPPKNLFPKPLPSDLITVPCCESCRSGTSDDDEYFRAMLLTAENLDGDSRINTPLEAVSRSMQKKSKSGFSKLILNSISEAEFKTKAGIYLGRKPIFKFDRDRISNVLDRIVRGLFYREHGIPVPKQYELLSFIDQFSEHSNDLFQKAQYNPIRWAANKMFLYTYAETIDRKYSGIWLGAFFEQVAFVSFVGKDVKKRPRSN